jgi:glycosyltransferase involved in cell wall biosynthesis
MRIGILLPGFSRDADDWAIPVQQNLAHELASTDDVRIIALRYPHQRTPYTLGGAAVYPLGAGQGRGVGRLRLWWNTLRLIRRLHRQQPFDVLHAMWADETSLVAVWAGRLLGIPVVVSVLGGELVGLREINYGLQRSRFSRWIVGQALQADRVIVPGSYVHGLIVQAGYRVPAAKIVNLTLGVDADRFTPASSLADPFRLIHVASLVPVKDQVTLLRAFALLDPRTTLDILGTGTEQATLEALCVKLSITDRVRFLGAVAHPDLPSHYQRAAIAVLSSRHEAGALATLEAAACGLPVVSTDVGIVRDYPGIGMTVPVGDAPALADAIQALIDDSAGRQALSQSARATIVRELTIQHTAAALRELYAEVRTGST